MMLEAHSLAILVDVKRGGDCDVSNDGDFILWYAGGVGTSTVL